MCGTVGTAPGPGAARCVGCGHVALVQVSPASPGNSGTPHAESKVALRGGNAVAPQRLATLWVRPGPEEQPTPDPRPLPVPRRPRTARRTLVAFASLAGGVALATASVVAIGPSWLRRDRGAEVAPAPASTLQRASAPLPSPAPQAVDAHVTTHEAVKKARVSPPRAPASAGPRIAALLNPAPVDRRCVPRALRARKDLGSRLPPEITVRFPVAADGAVGRIEVLGDLKDRDVAQAIEEAVRSCPFAPGSDENGRPVALPVVMRVRFSPAAASSGF